MASGSFGLTRTGSTSSYASFRADWSSYSNGSSANSSTVNVDVWVIKSSSSTADTYGNQSTDVSVSGGGSKNASGSFRVKPNSSTLLFRNSFTVPHNNDGTKKTTISVNIGGNVIWANGSQEVTLDTIPREASLVSAQNFNDEGNPVIEYSNPAGNSATVQACIADTNGNVQYAKYRNISSTGTKYTFELTDAERQALINAVPDGTNKMQVRFYLKTIINNATVGSPKNIQKEFTVINTTPEITSVVKDIGEYSVGTLTKDEYTMIRGFNHMHATMSVDLKKGAQIVSQSIQNGSTTVKASAAEFPLSEDNRFVFTVTDTFGNTVSEESYITMIEYVKLTCNITASNPTADGDMAFKISGNYFNGKFSNVGVNNELTLQWRFKENNDEYGEWISVTPVLSGNTYSVVINLTELNYKSTYTIQAKAIDLIETNGVMSPERFVRSIPVFNWGEDNFDIQVPLTVDNIHCTNIFNSKIELGSFNSSTGAKEDNAACYRNANPIEVEECDSYAIYVDGSSKKFIVLFYDQNNQFISETRNVLSDGVFVTPLNARYVNFRCYQADFTSEYESLKVEVKKLSPIQTKTINGQSIYGPGDLHVTPAPVILYDGGTDGNRGEVTLSDSVVNYEYIEFFYIDNNFRYGNSVKVFNINGQPLDLSIIEAAGDVQTYIRRTRYWVNGNKVTPDTVSYGYVYFDGTTIKQYNGNNNTNYIRIMRVVGYSKSNVSFVNVDGVKY